jgi:hypothetical protein
MAHWSVFRGRETANSGRLRWMFAICAMFVLFAYSVAAQEATIVGTVTDPTGAVVSNAKITVTNNDTALVRTAVTAADGQYVVPDLVNGHYKVNGSAKGFKSYEKTDLTLSVGDRVRVDIQLAVGGGEQTVTVEASQVQIQTDSGEVSNVINSQDVEKLETNGRSIYSLVNLTPGASSLQGDYQAPTPSAGDANVSFNGQRMGHNLYMLDGGEDLDRGGGGNFSVQPSLESIGEFRILTSNYSAEYGLSSAATTTTVLKAGTKAFHASGWEFDRNDALDARNYFNRAPSKVAELRSNIFGFNVGGPVSVHPNTSDPKTFFFYNMEWRRVIQGGVLNQPVPLPSTYQGNFTGSGKTVYVPCKSQLSPTLQTKFTNAGITTYSTTNSSGACNDDVAFANDTIPAALLDANAQALLTQGKIFPANTTGTTASNAAYQGGVNSPTTVQEEIVRVDHKFSDKFSVFGHWISEQIAQSYGTTMWSGDNVPTIGNTYGNPSFSGVIHTTYTINPNLLNEAAFNYNGNRIHILPKAGLGAPLAAPSSFTFNRIFPGPDTDSLMPTIALNNTGTQYTANWTPWNNNANDYQIRDDISWVKGAHQLKFGASWALYSKLQDYFAAPQGNFGFNGFFTGYDFADFLLGTANSYSEDAVHNTGHWDNLSYGLYAQDNWRASHRLTLNLGLRWDGVPHTYEVNQGSSNFYPSLYSAANAAKFDSAGNICSGATDPGCTAASPGLATSTNPILAGVQFYENGIGVGGKNGVPAGLVTNHWAAFGPRIGFAYDTTGAGKTVIRGGVGLMYERIQGNDMYDGATNVPNDVTATFSGVLLGNPHTSAITGATQTVPVAVPSIAGLDANNYKLPVSYQYSGGIQEQLASNTLLSVAYVGSVSEHQNDYREINLPPASALAGLINNGSNYNTLVPYLGFRSIKQAENEANGHYNSLQADLHTVIHKDLQAQFGYTLSRAFDASTGGGNSFDLDPVSNPYQGWRYDAGPSIFDRAQVAYVNYVYQIPLFRDSSNGAAKFLLGGWEVAGISTFESGAPLNVNLGGNQGSNGVQNGTNRPNLSGTVAYHKSLDTATGNFTWFNPSAFSAPALGSWGNLGHDALRGPGRDEWNLALHKIFKFTERANFEFRAEAFNVWNHTQLKADVNNGGYGNNFSGSNFGEITAAYDPREVQLGAKLSF